MLLSVVAGALPDSRRPGLCRRLTLTASAWPPRRHRSCRSDRGGTTCAAHHPRKSAISPAARGVTRAGGFFHTGPTLRFLKTAAAAAAKRRQIGIMMEGRSPRGRRAQPGPGSTKSRRPFLLQTSPSSSSGHAEPAAGRRTFRVRLRSGRGTRSAAPVERRRSAANGRLGDRPIDVGSGAGRDGRGDGLPDPVSWFVAGAARGAATAAISPGAMGDRRRLLLVGAESDGFLRIRRGALRSKPGVVRTRRHVRFDRRDSCRASGPGHADQLQDAASWPPSAGPLGGRAGGNGRAGR